MSAQPVAASDGLSAAELVHLIIFAANADLYIETSTTEGGSQYATLRASMAAGLDEHPGTWVVSRDQGLVAAFNEASGLLLQRATVADLLLDLTGRLPAKRALRLNQLPPLSRPLSVAGAQG